MEHDRHCDLQAPGPYEPDCGCRARSQDAEIERLRGAVQQHRENRDRNPAYWSAEDERLWAVLG